MERRYIQIIRGENSSDIKDLWGEGRNIYNCTYKSRFGIAFAVRRKTGRGLKRAKWQNHRAEPAATAPSLAAIGRALARTCRLSLQFHRATCLASART